MYTINLSIETELSTPQKNIHFINITLGLLLSGQKFGCAPLGVEKNS